MPGNCGELLTCPGIEIDIRCSEAKPSVPIVNSGGCPYRPCSSSRSCHLARAWQKPWCIWVFRVRAFNLSSTLQPRNNPSHISLTCLD